MKLNPGEITLIEWKLGSEYVGDDKTVISSCSFAELG
jgi:hypothetical protein